MHHRRTDGLTNRTDFIGPFPQRWRFHHFLGNSRIKLHGLIVSHIEKISVSNTVHSSGSK